MTDWQQGMTCYWPHLFWGINFVDVTIETSEIDIAYDNAVYHSPDNGGGRLYHSMDEISDTEEGAKAIARQMIQRELTKRISETAMLVDLFGNHNWQPIYESGKPYIRGQ